MKFTIERFEKNYAVCEREDGKVVDIERRKIPPEAREGDVIETLGDAAVVNTLETQVRR